MHLFKNAAVDGQKSRFPTHSIVYKQVYDVAWRFGQNSADQHRYDMQHAMSVGKNGPKYSATSRRHVHCSVPCPSGACVPQKPRIRVECFLFFFWGGAQHTGVPFSFPTYSFLFQHHPKGNLAFTRPGDVQSQPKDQRGNRGKLQHEPKRGLPNKETPLHEVHDLDSYVTPGPGTYNAHTTSFMVE